MEVADVDPFATRSPPRERKPLGHQPHSMPSRHERVRLRELDAHAPGLVGVFD